MENEGSMNRAATLRQVRSGRDQLRKSIPVLLLAAAMAVALAAAPVSAQEAEPEEPADGEGAETATFDEAIVVVGSRGEGRSVAESMVPVDVLTGEDFLAQGDTDVANLVRNLAPSYNVSMQPISDASSIVRPAYLRNLAPDHTLVLVNGRRRHRAAVIHWHGDAVSIGAQGPDLSVIPAIALRQVEVLRDGASAQYGSDAIAGVMNFMLKDASSGGSVEIRNGSYGEGDGDLFTAAANFGLPLGENGFFNVSMEYGSTDPTDRSIQRRDAANLIAAGNTHVRQPKAQIWGSPEVADDTKLFLNFGHLFPSSGRQFYGHANYASKTVNGGFFFRNPNTRGGVFSNDGGSTLLVGDLLDAQDGVLDGSAGCPTVAVTNHVPDPVALGRVFDDPNCFSYQELFPGGFTPNFGGDSEDMSIVAGLRGATSGGVGWDLSVSTGENAVDHFISNTVNASLGPDSPNSFSLGTYTQSETNLNFDLTYAVSERVDVAGGVEWRDEEFEIGRGQLESYQIGPLAGQGFSSGSNGFPGFSDIAAGAWGRSNYAAYGDMEVKGLNGRWTMGAALRFEDFEDFGTTVNGKIAGRYQVTDRMALRSSLSSGFRAPTPGQQNAFNVQTQFDTSIQDLVNNGTIPSTSAVAALRGGEPLEPEDVAQLRGWHGVRERTVRDDVRPLPHRRGGSDRSHPELPVDAGGGDHPGCRGGDERREPAELPVLRQRLRHRVDGRRPGAHRDAGVDGRPHQLRGAGESDPDGHRPRESGHVQLAPDPGSRGGAAGEQVQHHREASFAERPRPLSGPPELLRSLVRPRQQRELSRREHARPGGRLQAARRSALGVRRHERARHVPRGEHLRPERRRTVQRTDAVGIQRRVLVLAADLQLRRFLLAAGSPVAPGSKAVAVRLFPPRPVAGLRQVPGPSARQKATRRVPARGRRVRWGPESRPGCYRPGKGWAVPGTAEQVKDSRVCD